MLIPAQYPPDVPVKKAYQRRMRIARVVRLLVMTTMYRHPPGRAALQGRSASPRQHAPQPPPAHKASVRQQAMIADADAQAGDQIKDQKEKDIYRARPVPEAQNREGVNQDDERAMRPVQARQAASRSCEYFD